MLLAVVAVVVDDWLRYFLFGEEKPHYVLLGGVSPMVELLKNLTLGQIVQWAVLVMAALSTVLEFSKIKVNPWSAVGRLHRQGHQQRTVGRNR